MTEQHGPEPQEAFFSLGGEERRHIPMTSPQHSPACAPPSSDFAGDLSSGPRVTLGEASLNLRDSVATGKPVGKLRCLGF